MKISILDIFKKVVGWDKSLEIYSQGEDNQYPERQNRLRYNSITSKMASNIMLQYIIGKGLGNADNYKINPKQKLIDFATDLAQDIVNQRGVFIRFSYNENYEPVQPVILPFDRCRVGKRDSKEYNGKILYKVDWTNKKEDAQIYDVFNNNKEIVKHQIETAGDIEKYKGQVLFVNLDRELIYPLSRIDAVQNDCDSEAQASIYRNQLLRKGFFGKQIVVTPPLIENDLPEYILDDNGLEIKNRKWLNRESEADEVKETIEDFIGAENAGGAMLMQLPNFEGKIDDIFKVITIDSTLDDKMFEYTENQVSKNILMAYNNLPIGLVKSPDNSLFGNSGESLKAMQTMYWNNCDKDRQIVERIINDIVQNREDWEGGYIKFVKLGANDSTSNEN